MRQKSRKKQKIILIVVFLFDRRLKKDKLKNFSFSFLSVINNEKQKGAEKRIECSQDVTLTNASCKTVHRNSISSSFISTFKTRRIEGSGVCCSSFKYRATVIVMSRV